MGFKQRERKRMAKAAAAAAQRASRRTGSSQSRWWLTITTRKASCNRCGGVLEIGRLMVYRHVPREVLCPLCGESVSFRPSLRMEQVRTGKGRLRP